MPAAPPTQIPPTTTPANHNRPGPNRPPAGQPVHRPGRPQGATEAFALGSFLARWSSLAAHDLSASESATMTLPTLLAMAQPDDAARWAALDLDYSHPRGAAWLRAEIATRYRALDPDNIVCCAGAQEGLTCVANAILDPDDHAIVVLPIYQPSEWALTSVCATTGVALHDQGQDKRQDRGRWRLDIDRLAAAIRRETKLVLINFPNSPSGAQIDAHSLAALIALCRHYGLWLVNDEVYRLTTLDPTCDPPPIAALYERGISINSLSKGYGLAGLRTGWIACQDRVLLAKVLLAKSALSSCVAAPNEVLAHIALRAEAPIVARNRSIAQANLALLQACLTRHGQIFELAEPNNLAFYAPRTRLSADATDLATRLADAAGVLLLPWALWRSPLAEVPTDRLRIGLGGRAMATAVAALDDYLVRHVTPAEAHPW
ncbi:pyridoxal phosphate-dependent aminotransferase [Rhodopila sp.]|uniref:pyridoxal phosphate-dependent aminotransferase n=1 Tax=Rhodopila sp. TaxID=2480087 RepID=UPI003D143F69